MKYLLLLVLAGCSNWSSDSFWQGVADGSYSGCQYVIITELRAGKRKYNDNDWKMCSDVHNEWAEAYQHDNQPR